MVVSFSFSLQDMLIKEGLDDDIKILPSKKHVKSKDETSSTSDEYNPTMCIEIRQDGISSLDSGESISSAGKNRSCEPAIDEVAVRALISIMSGYLVQYLKDKNFRQSVRAKCYACFPKKVFDNGGVIAQLETTIENIEKIVEETRRKTKGETRLNLLRCSIRLLNIVAALNSKSSRKGWTYGIPNSHLSAIAQLYLAIVYKLEKNNRISATHLLQVFCDAPLLARIHLLPELWEYMLLPHILHLKIWQAKELEILRKSNYMDKEIRINALNEVYDAQMDIGTVKFAVYYKLWLKVGVQVPPVPV